MKTIAERLGTDFYMWIARVWVGIFIKKTKSGEKEAFDDEQYYWLFCNREHRTYAVDETVKDPMQMSNIVSINLIRAELFKRLTAVAVAQASLLVLLLSVGFFFLPNI